MIFCIQVGNPKFQNKPNMDDKNLMEAVESVFPLITENAILVWNYISIPLSYKYDISYMLDDIIDIIQTVKKNCTGKIEIHWLPDTFRCDWILEWSDNTIEIRSKWECTTGHLEDILNDNNYISMPINDFVSEWKELLGVVIRGLLCCGYDQSQIFGMKKLIEQYEELKETGVLYKTK